MAVFLKYIFQILVATNDCLTYIGEQKLAGKQFSLFTYCNDIPKKLNMYSPRFLFPIKRHIEYQIKQANNKNIKNKIKNLK